MKVIDFNAIKNLNISPSQCVEWVEDAFSIKSECDLPPKISQKLPNNIFINTMPCIIPSIGIGGVKIVSRYPERVPSLDSTLVIFDIATGEIIALMDADWITTMRTGAVAAISIKKLAKDNFHTIGMLGLGNTARSTLKCLHSIIENDISIVLKKYKNQAEVFINDFSNYKNIEFLITDNNEDLIKNKDVIISCVTAMEQQVGLDIWYSEGVLVVPVHTRGFQNCDLFFDKVFVDDMEHVKSFKYFDKFKYVNEISEVILGKDIGRNNNKERIISYNIGLALHDVYFAAQILKLKPNVLYEIDLNKPTKKIWA